MGLGLEASSGSFVFKAHLYGCLYATQTAPRERVAGGLGLSPAVGPLVFLTQISVESCQG